MHIWSLSLQSGRTPRSGAPPTTKVSIGDASRTQIVATISDAVSAAAQPAEQAGAVWCAML